MVNSLFQFQQNGFYDRTPWIKEEVPELERPAFYERRRDANEAVVQEYSTVRAQARRKRISRQYLEAGFVKRWQEKKEEDEVEAEEFISATEDEMWDNTYGEDDETYYFDIRFCGAETPYDLWYSG